MSTSIKTIRIVLDTTQAQTNSNALNTTINNTTNSTTNLNNSINTTNRTINRFDNSINTTNRTINRYVTNIRQATQATNEQAFATNKLATFIKGYIGIQAAMTSVQGIAALGDEYAKIVGLLRNATGSQDEFNSALAMSRIVAEKTRASLTATVETFAALNRVTQGTGKTQSELFRILETVNKAIAITSPTAAAASSALTQFGQALGGDFKASSQELNSILELAPGLAELVAKGLGVPTKALKKMAEEGKLSTELVITSLASMSSEADAKFANIERTVSSATTQIRNDLLATFGDAKATEPLIEAIEGLGEKLKDPETTQGVVSFGVLLTTVFGGVITILGSAAQAVIDFAQGLGETAAGFAGLISESDTLDIKIKNLKRSMGKSWFNQDFSAIGKTDEEIQKLIDSYEALQVAEAKEHGLVMLTSKEKAKIASDKKLQDEAEARNLEEKAKLKVIELKQQKEKELEDKKAAEAAKKKNTEIEREIANLRELLNTKGQSKEVEIVYKLKILGASPEKIKEAAAMAKELDEREAQKKIQKATETTNDEVASAQLITKQLEVELQNRIKVSDFYREANRVKNKDSFEYERALLLANELESIANIDRQEAESVQKREDQLRKALDHENLTNSNIDAIKSTYREQSKAAEAAFEEQRTSIAEDAANRRIELARAEKNARITLYTDLANTGLAILQTFGSDSFQSQKNFAIASGIVSIAGGVAQALNNPYPANLGFAAQVALQGAKLIKTIKSTKPGSTSTGSIGGGGVGSSGGLPTTNGNSSNEEQFRQRQVIEIRGIGPDSLITGSQLAEILGRDDNVVVALAGAQADAQRRGVI